jgi:ABC-type nitrate/sulfonate/bicarbonate transport system substrate-binding protein
MNKVLVVIVALVVVFAGAAAFLVLKDDNEKDREINLISGVNLEGSGMFIKSDVDIDTMIEITPDGVQYKPEGWGGKVFATPGATSIQHILLKSVVEDADKIGLRFLPYQAGASLSSDAVYHIVGLASAADVLANTIIDGGMSWQPQLERIVSDDSGKFQPLVLTNDMFPGHLCSVVAGNHSYTSTHQDETVRFVAAFIKATEWTANALANPGSDDYNRLIDISLEVIGWDDTPNNRKMMEDSFTVTYVFGENTDNPLSGVKRDIASYTDSLYAMGDVLRTPLIDLGFDSTRAFVDKFVDDSFMKKALASDEDDLKAGKKADIRVAVISGDTHQIAVHVANSVLEEGGKSFFEQYGLNVSFSYATNGGGVAVALQNGDSNIGILGSPPIIISTVNSGLIKG